MLGVRRGVPGVRSADLRAYRLPLPLSLSLSLCSSNRSAGGCHSHDPIRSDPSTCSTTVTLLRIEREIRISSCGGSPPPPPPPPALSAATSSGCEFCLQRCDTRYSYSIPLSTHSARTTRVAEIINLAVGKSHFKIIVKVWLSFTDGSADTRVAATRRVGYLLTCIRRFSSLYAAARLLYLIFFIFFLLVYSTESNSGWCENFWLLHRSRTTRFFYLRLHHTTHDSFNQFVESCRIEDPSFRKWERRAVSSSDEFYSNFFFFFLHSCYFWP